MKHLVTSTSSPHSWADWTVPSSKSPNDWTLVYVQESLSPKGFASLSSTSRVNTRKYIISKKTRSVTLMPTADAPQQLWSSTLLSTLPMQVLKRHGAITHPFITPLLAKKLEMTPPHSRVTSIPEQRPVMRLIIFAGISRISRISLSTYLMIDWVKKLSRDDIACEQPLSKIKSALYKDAKY